MLKELPTWIDPTRLALTHSHLNGRIAFVQMERLRDSLCDIQGDAQIDWFFAMDDKQRQPLSVDCKRSF